MNWLHGLLRRRQAHADLSEEIQEHLDEKIEELVAQGMSRDEATAAARRAFGNTTGIEERGREVWEWPALENLLRDVRYSLRMLRKAPGFTVVAILTLALGIGATTAIFSVIDSVLLQPLPFPQSDRIVVLWEHPPQTIAMRTAALASRNQQNPVSPINFLDWRDRTTSFDGMAALSSFPMGLSGFGEPREVDTLHVSASFFDILGVAPMLGQVFHASDDVPNGPPVAVLSYGLWRQQFGGDPGVVGRTIRLLEESYTIVGVMPARFDLPFDHAEIWVPIQLSRSSSSLEGRFLHVIAKLKPGVPLAQAQSELASVAKQISTERPFTNLNWSAGIVSLYEQTTGEVSTALLLLFGAVSFLLLIATGNVANLLLMRGTQRRREIAVRAALGASRSRIASQLLAESLLLSLAGGVLGIVLAIIGLRAIVDSLLMLALPRMESIHFDMRVLGFSIVLTLVTTLLFGFVPALSFSRADPREAIEEGSVRTTSSGSRRMRAMLVIVEVALSLVLLVGASLLIHSFFNETGVNRGFRIDHILTMRMFFAPTRYDDNERRARYLEQILEQVRALPGVEAASSAHFLPMVGEVSGSCFTRSDQPAPSPGTEPGADFLIVSSQYFNVMGTPFLEGRDFNNQDTISTEPSIIVNQAFANRFFPGEDAVGKRLGLCWNVTHGEIIGVTANARQTDLTVDPKPTIFLYQAQTPMYFAALVIRTAVPPTAIANSVEDTIHRVDPDQAISHVESMEQVVSASVARPRVESALLMIFASVALVLSAIGLYGVLSYSVTQRTREIGIRMALGANSPRVMRDVIRDGSRLIVPGIVAGLVAAFALTRLLGSLLYGIEPTDPLTYATVSLVLVIVGLFASWLPARRAMRVDPMIALRYE
jgi:putative ABC transport system permease protein